MTGIDTNILVRMLVADDKQQAQKVLRLFKQAEQKGESFFVSNLVLLELVWVLESVYECDRDEIVAALERLTLMPVLSLEKTDAVYKVVQSAQDTSQDISDLLIAYCAAEAGCDRLLTFDKRAAKHKLFQKL